MNWGKKVGGMQFGIAKTLIHTDLSLLISMLINLASANLLA